MFQAQLRYTPYFYLQIKVRKAPWAGALLLQLTIDLNALLAVMLDVPCPSQLEIRFTESCTCSASPCITPNRQDGLEMEVDALLRRKHESAIRDVSIVDREDLDLVRSPKTCPRRRFSAVGLAGLYLTGTQICSWGFCARDCCTWSQHTRAAARSFGSQI